MKKCIFFVFLYLSIVTNLFSSIFSVELSPSAGVMLGRASEYVYLDYKNYQGIQNYNEQLSQLDYDYTVPYISLNVDSKLFSFVHLGANFSIGIPIRCGIMQDYDWMNVYSPSNKWKNELTNYSKHENYLDHYIDVNFELGPIIDFSGTVTLVPFVGLGYESIKFTAQNGFFRYGKTTKEGMTPIDEDCDEFSLTGKDIEYRQYSANKDGGDAPHFNLGLNYKINAIPRFCIKGSFVFFPFYSICSYDYHIRTNTQYISVIEKSFKFLTNLDISFLINDMFSVGVFGEFSVVPQFRGITYSKSTWANSYSLLYDCQSGIDRISGKVSLSAHVKF